MPFNPEGRMTPESTSPAPAPIQPAIQTREQLETVLENIVHLQQERGEMWHTLERELTAVRQKYQPPLAEMDRYLAAELSWVEAWTLAHPELLGSGRALDCAHATIGYRALPPRIERASRRWTWTRIALTLADLPWGRRYLRQPEREVDKDALLADLAELSPHELRAAGIKVLQGERFFLTPKSPGGNAGAGPSAETAWPEAA